MEERDQGALPRLRNRTEEHCRGEGMGPRNTANDWSPAMELPEDYRRGMETPKIWSQGISDIQQATRKRVKKERKNGFGGAQTMCLK
jgi:hypothetical protein